MNRNSVEKFALNPTLTRARSKLNRPQDIKLTGNIGACIPFYIDDVLPGDSMKIKTSKVVRLTTPLTPFMDNIYLDTYYFFVPNRLIWSNFKHFMGESDAGWTPVGSWTEPQITSPASTGWTKGSIADYLGVPIGKTDLSISALPFRAYAKIIDDWFRYTPLQDPLNIPVNDSTQTGTNGTSYVNDIANGGAPFIAKKMPDYFTMALPAPQRGPAVSLNIAGLSGPVFGNGKSLGLTDGTNFNGFRVVPTYGFDNSDTLFGADLGTGGSFVGNDLTKHVAVGVPTKEQLVSPLNYSYTGLVAEINNSSLVTINELRQAFQVQKWYEALARGGDRYISIIKEMFDVNSPDARLQRSEYLGGNRVPMQVNQVLQMSKTDGSDKLGKTGAYSLTVDTHFDVDKSFTEHGYIIGIMVARYHHTYQQGLEKFWSRKTKFDYYWPVFQNLGEQAIKNKEIFAQGSSVLNPDTNKPFDDEVFGYQEAWAEYRYKPSRVAGEFRSDFTTPLDNWHLADDYASLPSLSDSWVQEDKTNVDRVLTVASTTSDQFFADIYVENESIRPMPIYSIPGFMDHN